MAFLDDIWTALLSDDLTSVGRVDSCDAMISPMRTIITLPDHMHARAKQRAAELGISFAEFARRLFEKEFAAAAPQGDIDAICAMVTGTSFDMARDGERIVGEAAEGLLTGRHG